MYISSVELSGYRNFAKTTVALQKKSLLIGANDVGKTNFIAALRTLLDRSVSEQELEPTASDFHIPTDGVQVDRITITVNFSEVVEDAVLSTFAGHVSADGELTLRYEADRKSLEYRILVGRDSDNLELIPARYYLRHLNMKVVDSRRDLSKFIQSEKRQLLKLAQDGRTPDQAEADEQALHKVERGIDLINKRIAKLNYVFTATSDVNAELRELAHNNAAYGVHLNSAAIETQQFIEKLELAGNANGSTVMLGGDGRNNQILLALWRAKSVREYDPENEVIIYCVEEPEAHLHPHQQRKLASYLSVKLPGQTLVTTHSPQIVSSYSPESIARLLVADGGTKAASGGCSPCIHASWDKMGYRISILPAEAFFSSVVFLVEGPSELLFYRKLAAAIGIDLDYFNISILSVDGVQFEVYAQILAAMEIPFVLRTDNDISKILTGPDGAKVEQRQLAGLNRCLSLLGQPKLPHQVSTYTWAECIADGTWENVSKVINAAGIFISYLDLENDLKSEFWAEMLSFRGTTVEDTVTYLQDKKATRMREFLVHCGAALNSKGGGELAKPLHKCVEIAMKVSV